MREMRASLKKAQASAEAEKKKAECHLNLMVATREREELRQLQEVRDEQAR